MKQNKQMYLSPETEVLVVRFEDSLLNSGSPNGIYGTQGAAGAVMEDDDDYTYSL